MDEQAFRVPFKQRIPVAAPQNLDAIPTGAAESGFQFLHDFSVAAHGTIETLQVAIDDKNKVVEIFARRQRDRAQSFRLVRFAVSEKRPDFRVRAGLEAAIFQIAIEPRLINGHERAEAHGHRGKFPELRHQPRMRVRRQSAALPKFAAEVFQLFHGQAAFEKRARINAGRSMSLEINRVALELVGASAEKMVEADFKQRRGGGVRGNVAADAVVDAVGANHHRQRVPANQALDAPLDFLIAWEDGLLFMGNGIQIRSVCGEGKRDAEGLSVAAKPVQQSDRGFLPFFAYDLVEGFYPFLYFLGIHP